MSTHTSSNLSASVLGQLLLMQSVLEGLPNEAAIRDFVCRGLSQLPGVHKAEWLESFAPAADELTQSFPLTVGNSRNGVVVLHLIESSAFLPYKPYIENFCFMLAIIVEERHQRHLLENYNAELEKRVAERTNELTLQIAEQKKLQATIIETEERFRRALLDTLEEQSIAKAALSESERKFRLLAENAHDLIYRYRFSPTRGFEYVSPSATAITGYTPEEHYADPDLGLKLIHPNDRHILDEITQGKTPPNAPLVFRWIRKDGAVIWTEQRNRLIRDELGNLIAIEGIARDITERKQTEKKLNDLFTAINASGDVVFLTDKEGMITSINSQFTTLYGYSADEVVGKVTPRILKSGLKDKEFYTQFWESILRGEVVRMELINKAKNGSLIPIEETVSPFLDDNGAVAGFLAIQRNISERKKAEELLIRSEKNLREAQRIAHLGNWSAELKDGSFYWSDEMYNIYGVDRNTFVLSAESFLSLIHPDDKALMNEWYEQILAGKTHEALEFRIKLSDGTIRYIKGYADLVKDTAGKPVRVIGTAQDITESKKAEEQIKRLNRVDAVLSNVNQAIVRLHTPQELFNEVCRVAVDDGKFLLAWIGLVNEETHKIDIAASAGKTEPYLHNLTIDLNDIKHSNKPSARAIKTGKPCFSMDIQHDEMMLPWAKNAAIMGFKSLGAFPLTVFGKTVGSFNLYSGDTGFFDESETKLLSELASDISFVLEFIQQDARRKQAEQELRMSEEKYRTIFENIQDVYYETTMDGIILEISPSIESLSKKQYSRNDLIGKSIYEFYAEPHQRQRLITELNMHGYVSDFEITLKNRDGSLMSCSISSKIQHDAEGKTIKIIGSLRDITERKQVEESRKNLERQLQQAQKIESLGTLASGIAHDFNNILGIILGYSTILPKQFNQPERAMQSLAAMTSAAKRGAALVKQLLTFARKTEAKVVTMDINELISELQKLLKETLPKTIVIKTSLQKELPFISADPTQIHQVLLNLCVNARDAMPKGGTLSIATEKVSGESIAAQFPNVTFKEYVLIRVTDTGIGMDEATKQRIFEPFFTTKDVGKGTGLGLALVFSIVGRHQGFIDVESTVGMGTTFSIYLPIEEHQAETSTATEIPLQEVPGGSETILVVEDEELMRELLTTFLTAKGYTVLAAADGLEGVASYSANQHTIAVVISDLGLPKLAGEDLCKQIYSINPTAKIIVASGFIEPKLKTELEKEGVKHFIQKPYEPREVLRAIREELDRV